METKKVLIVGLGNYTHLHTRHSIGLLFLDYMASQLNLTWSKKGSIHAYTTHTTILVDPSQSSTKQTKQTKQSKKKKKTKKKEWDFCSESDEDIKGIDNCDITTSDEGDDLSSGFTPLHPSSSLNAQTKSSLPSPIPTSMPKPKKSKRNPDPVPLELILLKPLLLMNVSGKSVSRAARELGFSHSNIIIIHDDIQRKFGKFSIKNGGSANGHNGIKSVIEHLKTNEFRRLCIGVGRPPNDDQAHDIVSKFVLSRVPPNEMEVYKDDVFPRCKDELLMACINSDK